MRISKVAEIEADGIKTLTSGHLPNIQGDWDYQISYTGTLAVEKFIAFVDETENVYQPCYKNIASASAPAAKRTGAHQVNPNPNPKLKPKTKTALQPPSLSLS